MMMMLIIIVLSAAILGYCSSSPTPLRLGDPAVCGSHPLVTP